MLGNPTNEGTYFTNALKFHSKWAIVKHHLYGLVSIYTRITERPGSTAYPHKAVTASLQQRVEIVASARLQARLLCTKLDALRAQRARVAALQRLSITQIAYSGDTHVGTAWAPDMPGAVPTVRHGKRATQCTQRTGTRKWGLMTGSGRSDLCMDPRKAGPRDPAVLARCIPHTRVSFASRHTALPVYTLKVLPSANGPLATVAVAAAVASAVI